VSVEYGQGKRRYDACVDFIFHIIDGAETISMKWYGMGSDYSVPDKALYKAITSGHKYFVAKLLMVGAGNEDGEHDEESSKKVAQKPASPAPTTPQEAPGRTQTAPVIKDASAAQNDAVDAKTPIMTLETARAVMTNDKTPKAYGSIDRDTLAHMATSIQGKLLKHGYPDDQIETAEFKLAAIKTILAQPVEALF